MTLRAQRLCEELIPYLFSSSAESVGGVYPGCNQFPQNSVLLDENELYFFFSIQHIPYSFPEVAGACILPQ
jgi:hypothetical protein